VVTGWRSDLAMGGSETEAWGAGGGGAESKERRGAVRRGPMDTGRRAPRGWSNILNIKNDQI
jgi:hypothetical protein